MSNEEFEDLFGNTPLKNIEKIKEYINKNYIDKDKIRDKIELHTEYLINQAVTSNPTLDAHFRDKEKYIIQVLKELLEEE